MTDMVGTVTLKVQRILTQHLGYKFQMQGDVMLLAFEDASTVVTVRCVPFGSMDERLPQVLVHIECPLLIDVKPTPELLEWVARNATKRWFGAVSLGDGPGDDTVHLSLMHTLVGDTIDPMELALPLLLMLKSADELDDELQARFGGKRMADVRKA
jgi:hypothetical protein